MSLIGLGVVTLVLSRTLGFIFRDREDPRPLDIAKVRLEKRLPTLPQNILFVIDDIDRLEPERIRKAAISQRVHAEGRLYSNAAMKRRRFGRRLGCRQIQLLRKNPTYLGKRVAYIVCPLQPS